MPYIEPEDRVELYGALGTLTKMLRKYDGETRQHRIRPGDLNYVITWLIQEFVGIPSYEKLNAAVGVLECAKLELYRRMAAPYEDKKCEMNGDVY